MLESEPLGHRFLPAFLFELDRTVPNAGVGDKAAGILELVNSRPHGAVTQLQQSIGLCQNSPKSPVRATRLHKKAAIDAPFVFRRAASHVLTL
jgi:hypothetical protein